MQTENATRITLVMTAKDVTTAILTMLAAGAIACYVPSAIWLHTWTPGPEIFRATPDGYQSIRAFRATRTHDFPALYEEPPPSPVAGTGHLVSVGDGPPYGTDAPPGRRVDVKTLYVTPVFGPRLVAHLDVPLNPDLQDHLRGLRKGALVTVAGIGHGNGENNIYIYPVHQVNGHAP